MKYLEEIELAKEKISSGDYLGARKMLLQVKRDFPAVYNISGMIAVCDILISAGLKFMDLDFYFVLQIPSEATSPMIKFKYSKFTTLLEPIANNFPGAASALRRVQDAFSVLSHQEKRKMFDIKRARKLESCVSGISNEDNVVDSHLAREIWIPRQENSQSSRSCRMCSYKAGDGYGNVYESTSMEVVSNCLGERQVHEAQAQFAGEQKREIYEMFELDHLGVPTVSDWDVTRGSCCESSLKLNHAIPLHKPSLKLKWSIKDFTSEQVWAIYDGQDLMPRRYAVVNNVISWSKVSVTLLEKHPKLDEDDSLPFASGSFRCGETTLDLDLSRFSHTVNCEKIEEWTLYRIYPKKGEVWAMYKNRDETRKYEGFNGHYQCQILEIVKDFSQESGLIAVSLTEVPGRKTFFERQLQNGHELCQTITSKEMGCFSHQVPAYTVEGSEFHGIPKGSWHLEPDALLPTLSSTSLESKMLDNK